MEHESLDDLGSSLIRPYVLTGGRTRPEGPDLPIESLVVTSPTTKTDRLGYDHAKIANACLQPISIAELAAALDIPLGVTRILVSDLLADGVLDANPTTDGSTPTPELIGRLIEGIRAL
jgi:hypothetical protein